MARKARQKSESGMYHVVLKGNDKLLFVEDEDYRFFLLQLSKIAERDFLEAYAYCLYPENVHLVVKEGLRPLGESVKALTSAYAVRCNEKYAREGKLFYDRFISEPIESDDELIDAVRFVHRLPLSYGGELSYPYSSYNNYTAKKGLRSDSLMLLLGDSVMSFKSETDKQPTREFCTGEKRRVLTDGEVISLVRRITGSMTAQEAENITLPVLGEIAAKLQSEGAGIRQLSRVLMVGKSNLERALRVYRQSLTEKAES